MVYWCINYLIDGMKQAGNVLEVDWKTKEHKYCENGRKPTALMLTIVLDLALLNAEVSSEITEFRRLQLAQSITMFTKWVYELGQSRSKQ